MSHLILRSVFYIKPTAIFPSVTVSTIRGKYTCSRNPNIYVEKTCGFSTRPIEELENERQRVKFVENVEQNPNIFRNSNLGFAMTWHQMQQKIFFTLLGLLAGANVVHTVIVQSIIIPKALGGDNEMLLIYGRYAKEIVMVFYISMVMVGIFLFDRFDIARPTKNCIERCINFKNGSSGALFYTLAFGTNNAMIWLYYTITVTPEAWYLLRTWQVLEAFRCAFILLAWLVTSMTILEPDRLTHGLSLDPMTESSLEEAIELDYLYDGTTSRTTTLSRD